MKSIFQFSYACLVSFLLASCGGGGGGGGSSDSAATTRPKTLDGLSLIISNDIEFEFVRNTGTAAAVNSGDIETGTFFYRIAGNRFRTYRSAETNAFMNSIWPTGVSAASYTYRAINETSGRLTLNGVGTGPIVAVLVTDLEPNASEAEFFKRTSTDLTSNQVVIDIGFTSNGNIVDPSDVVAELAGTTTPIFDRLRLPTSIRITSGGNVPVNYNPNINPNRPSRIVPQSLNNLVLLATSGTADPTKNFTILFSRDASMSSTNSEIGQGILRINGGAPTVPGVNYTWQRTSGTDSGTLVLSNDPTIPPAFNVNGSYTLNFLGTEVGTYTGADADRTGTFTISPGP